MINKTIGYLWLSSDNSDNDPNFIINKQNKIADFCRLHHLDLIDVLIDNSPPGKLHERPQLRQVFSSTPAWSCIVVDSLQDVGRRFHDVYWMLSHLQENPCRLLSIAENFDSDTGEVQGFLATLARIPQLKTSALVPTIQRSQEARYNGGACPYGYQVDARTNQYEIVPSESTVIRRIFRDRLAGRSLRQIAQSLTYEGIKTKRGGRWQANTIKTILENKFYTGVYQTHYKEFEHDHPAIISAELFRQANPLYDQMFR